MAINFADSPSLGDKQTTDIRTWSFANSVWSLLNTSPGLLKVAYDTANLAFDQANNSNIHIVSNGSAQISTQELNLIVGDPTLTINVTPDAAGDRVNVQISIGGAANPWTPTAGAADKATMEAATSNAHYVTPNNFIFFPGTIKAWSMVENDGTPAITAANNVVSVTDIGVGILNVVFGVDFASANYASFVSSKNVATGNGGQWGVNITATTFVANQWTSACQVVNYHINEGQSVALSDVSASGHWFTAHIGDV